MTTDLDKLFSDFDAKKQGEADAARIAESARQQSRDASVQILTTIVLPIIRDVSETIIGNGHISEARERFENYVYPAVELTFKPVLKAERPVLTNESSLSFAHTDAGRIKITQKVKGLDGKESPHGYETNGEWELADVSQVKVRDRAAHFIEAVLKAN